MTKRRDVLLGSGTVATGLLAGRLPVADAGDGDGRSGAADGDDAADADPTPFAMVPGESAVDAAYLRLVRTDLGDVEQPSELSHEAAFVGEIDDLDVAAVETVATVDFGDSRVGAGAAVGSFDRPDPGEAVDEDGVWRIADDEHDRRSFASADGRLAFASGGADDRIVIVEAAVDAARGEADSALDDVEHAADAFGRLEAKTHAFFIPNVDELGGSPGGASLEAFAGGFDVHPSELHGTVAREQLEAGRVRNEYLLYPPEDLELADGEVETIARDLEPAELVELTFERDGGVVHVETVAAVPPEHDRDAAPDARIRTAADSDRGVVEFEHAGGESIDAAKLEVWLDGELADVQPDAEYDEFDAGDVLRVDTGPLATVALRWFDGDENVHYVYDEVVVGRDAFDVEHDVAGERVEVTYTGERPADPSKLRLRHRRAGERPTPEDRFRDGSGELRAGDAVTVEDVALGDQVVLELDVPPGPGRGRTTLVDFHAAAPRIYVHRRPEQGVSARYRGPRERDADAFRVLVDGEPATVQFADVRETLAPGDEVELGAVPIGSEVVVEWLEPAEPVAVAERVIVPRAKIEFEYDDADGRLTAVHRGGDDIDADELAVRVDGEPADEPVDGESGTFGPGDAFAFPVEPFAVVELVWLGPGDHERGLGRTVTATDSIEPSYDPDAGAVELVYVGEQPADPGRLGVRHVSGGPVRSGEPEPLFDAAHETLTAGDAVVVEDVAPDDSVLVVLAGDAEPRRHRPWLVRFSPKPAHAFRFEVGTDGLVAVYRGDVERDADAFRVLADGRETPVQPADEHGTIEPGDAIALGSFPPGTELAIEWTVPDEPVEIDEHLVAPDAAFDASYDADEGTVVVKHVGGDVIDADDLDVFVRPSPGKPVGWDDHETVSAGDATAIPVDEEPVAVFVVFRERKLVDELVLEGHEEPVERVEPRERDDAGSDTTTDDVRGRESNAAGEAAEPPIRGPPAADRRRPGPRR